MAKLIDSDADSLEIYQNLLTRGEAPTRETEEIYPHRAILRDGFIIKLDWSFMIFLSLITERNELVFIKENNWLNPEPFGFIKHTDSKAYEDGSEEITSVPLLMLRKHINKINGNDWYGDDDNDTIIIVEHRNHEERTMYFLKKISNSQLEILKNKIENNDKKIVLFEIDKIPEKEKENDVVRRIIILNNLFKITKPI